LAKKLALDGRGRLVSLHRRALNQVRDTERRLVTFAISASLGLLLSWLTVLRRLTQEATNPMMLAIGIRQPFKRGNIVPQLLRSASFGDTDQRNFSKTTFNPICRCIKALANKVAVPVAKVYDNQLGKIQA